MGLFSRTKNAIAKRCATDSLTKARLRYDPYYHTFEKQEGCYVWLQGKKHIMLSSNDYLGLSFHPQVMEAAQKAVEQWGTSATGSRMANGSRAYHHALEENLADFLGKEACHVHVAGYISCVSAVESFATRGDLVLLDKNLHSCLVAGGTLSGAKVERFSHNSMADLREILSYEKAGTAKLLVLEGVYSMEGHITPLDEFVKIAKEHDLFVVVDDAHGFGVLGEGRGTCHQFGVTDEVDIICGSMSKALSSTGGFVAGDREIIEYMRTHSKQTIFSAGLSPSQCAAAQASLQILRHEPTRVQKLWENTAKYKKILLDLGLDIWDSQTPAIPIVIGDKEKAYYFWKNLLSQGVFTVMSTAPAVPPGKDLVRTAISAEHTDEDLAHIASAMEYAVKKM